MTTSIVSPVVVGAQVTDTTRSWPPIPDAVLSPMAGWSSWYEGTPESLSSHYTIGYGSNMARPRVRPSQMDGGVIGALARFWWGQPQTGGQQARSVHLPLAGDIAAASSDLLFGQELDLDFGIQSILGPDGRSLKSPKTNDRLMEILDANSWQALLPEAGELQAALGGVYLRCLWDQDVSDTPIISVSGADQVIPTFRYGRLIAATFWNVVKRDGISVWRHLEIHEKGIIKHRLYKGTNKDLGQLVPLQDNPETAPWAPLGDVTTGIDRLTVEYVPNIRPSRRWRNLPEGCNLGRADIDGTEPLLDALDETWNSLIRDMRHGKSRILASNALLASNGIGQGATLDIDREVYESLNVPVGQDQALSQLIHAQQFNIRVEEHLRIAEGLMGAIVRGAGYSGQTFGLDTAVAKTATEVESVRDRTRQTREKKTRYWTPALERFLAMMMEIDREVFGKGGDIEVTVRFPSEAVPSLSDTAKSLQMLRAAEAVSTETAVRLAQPDWDDEQVFEEVERILEEKKASAPTFVMGGADLNPDQLTTGEEQDTEAQDSGAPSPAPESAPPEPPAKG